MWMHPRAGWGLRRGSCARFLHVHGSKGKSRSRVDVGGTVLARRAVTCLTVQETFLDIRGSAQETRRAYVGSRLTRVVGHVAVRVGGQDIKRPSTGIFLSLCVVIGVVRSAIAILRHVK